MIVRKLLMLVPIKNKLIRTSKVHIEPETFRELVAMFMRITKREQEQREASRVRIILGWSPYGAKSGGFQIPNDISDKIIPLLKKSQS